MRTIYPVLLLLGEHYSLSLGLIQHIQETQQ